MSINTSYNLEIKGRREEENTDEYNESIGRCQSHTRKASDCEKYDLNQAHNLIHFWNFLSLNHASLHFI